MPALLLLPLALSGCDGTGLNPDAFEVSLNNQYRNVLSDRIDTVLTIRSIESDPIAVSKVNVNNGRCHYTGRYNDQIKLPAYFQIGQSLQLYLNCSADAVVKVDVETDKGAASYTFK